MANNDAKSSGKNNSIYSGGEYQDASLLSRFQVGQGKKNVDTDLVILDEKQSQTESYFRSVSYDPLHAENLLVRNADNVIRIVHSDQCTLSLEQPENVYAAIWVPRQGSKVSTNATEEDGKGLAVLVSTRDQPIKLYSALTGNCEGTYVVSAQEVLQSPFSLALSNDGRSFHGGLVKELVSIDIETGTELLRLNTQKHQRGILNALSASADHLLAAGSTGGQTAIYDTREKDTGLPLLQLQAHLCPRVAYNHTQTNTAPKGVTQVLFSKDARFLFTGARCRNDIYCWDIRHTRQVLAVFPRASRTNARIGFDLDPQTGCYLATGSDDGTVLIYDLSRADPSGETACHMEPVFSWDASCVSNDKKMSSCVSDVSFASDFSVHHPVLAACSGQRVFPDWNSNSDSDDEDMQNAHNGVHRGTVTQWRLPFRPSNAR